MTLSCPRNDSVGHVIVSLDWLTSQFVRRPKWSGAHVRSVDGRGLGGSFSRDRRPEVLKKYCSLIHGQPVLEAVLDLKRRNGLAAAEIEQVRCDIFQTGFDIAGGGSFGSKDHPQTKEQGDYNLKYLIASALLDNQV